MDVHYCLHELSVNATAIQYLVADMDTVQARWKPGPADWSVLEVINHLADEEREDFRARIRHVLSGSDELAPPINPQGWVIERAYNQRDLGASVADYLQERQRSLEWLRGLVNVSWEMTVPHSPRPGFRLGDLLVSWAAHDILHQRQLVELKWAYGVKSFEPYSPDYAGDW
jgi:hypothetical protein